MNEQDNIQAGNEKVQALYDYLRRYQSEDSDFWPLGGGHQRVQQKLNRFGTKDWKALQAAILHWSEEEQETLLLSIPFGFDGMFTPVLDEQQIAPAGALLLSAFFHLEAQRAEIAYFTFFINKSGAGSVAQLTQIKDWLLQHGYDKLKAGNPQLDPIYNITQALLRAKS